MQEAYYEESAVSLKSASESKISNVFRICAYVFFVIALFVLFFSVSYISYVIQETAESGSVGTRVVAIVEYFLFDALIGGAGFAFWFMKNKFNLSYDYTFVEDELRVSKVFNGRKRKFLKSFKADQILKLGKCDGESFERTCAGMSKKSIRFLTPNREPAEEKDFYYLLYSSTVEKAVYILEARKELMEYLIRAAGRNKWEAR